MMSRYSKNVKFWKPGDEVPVEHEVKEDGEVVHYSVLSMAKHKENLPIFQYRNHILYLLEHYRTVIIVGETGSGKSTQIPQYLLEAGWTEKQKKGIVITQPRRIAAVTLAGRVADELNVKLGYDVGYAIRFDDCTDPSQTEIKYVTEGVLLSEMMTDPLLKKYSVVMIDEAHERSVNTDICLGLLKKIQAKRPDLRLIISSATVDAEKLKEFFETGLDSEESVYVLSIEGRHFPIDIFYTKDPVSDYIKTTIDTILQIHLKEESGDILAFLTGQDEVEKTVKETITRLRQLRDQGVKKYLQVLPLYSALPANEQMKVFEPKPNRHTRRVIVATNIAETSVSIEGVVYVVDCGYVKLNMCDPKTGVYSLAVQTTSQASLQQRAGRAGRFRKGKAFRLFTEDSLSQLPLTTVPEIQRCDLLAVILYLKALGVDNVAHFDFLSPPPAECMVRGLELLYALGALDQKGNLTQPLGQKMAEFPFNPMYVKMLLLSEEYECSEEIASIVAMLQIRKVAVTPMNERGKANTQHRKFSVKQGDLVTLLNIYNSFVNEGNETKRWCGSFYMNYLGLKQAVKIRTQLCKYMSRFSVKMVSCRNDISKIQMCIVTGLFMNAAKLHTDGHYRGLYNDKLLDIDPKSVLARELPKWVVYSSTIQSASKILITNVTSIDPEWLPECSPHFYEWGIDLPSDAKRARIE